MITVVYRMVTYVGKEKVFEEVAKKCIESARSSKGCIKYSFFRSLTNPCEFLVHYQFTTKKDQDVHIENLKKLLGPSPTGRDLPLKFIELLKEEDVVLFKDDAV